MWFLLACLSALLLGFYDVCKKTALRSNGVITILFLNTFFSSLIFLPLTFQADFGGWEVQQYVLLKAVIVLISWALGYLGMKHLPLTIVGPINATRPVMVLIGALLFFGERLNAWQWAGVTLAILAFYLLSITGRKEGINFRHNRWILSIIGAAVMGAVSGLYDKYLMTPQENGGIGLPSLTVQCYNYFYQCFIMGAIWLVSRRTLLFGANKERLNWTWTIPLISIFLSLADYAYFTSLSMDGAMISVISMVRRSSVLVSFMMGALIFREKNLRSKAIDLLLVFLSMLCLWMGRP